MAICRVLSKVGSSISSIRRFSTSDVPTSPLQRVGFVGLGNMGSRMANNLIKAGYKVSIHDVNHNVMKIFSEKGILTKESPLEVAEISDVVVTMLPSSSHVLDVYTGPNGLLNGGNLLRPWLYIDSSTIDPQTSRKLSLMVSNCALQEKKGYLETPVMLDAPVSGGVLAAEAGALTFMVGGSEEAFLAAKPLFLSMGKNTIYCGGPGNGSAAKICNNLAMSVSMLGVSEAFAIGQSLGIDARTLTNVFNSSSARCWSRMSFPADLIDHHKCVINAAIQSKGDAHTHHLSLLLENEDRVEGKVNDTYNPVPGLMDGVPSSRNYDGGFASKLMAKDLNLAAASAKEVGLKYPMTSQAKDIFTELCEEGQGTKDFSCVFRHYYSGMDEL